MAYIRHDLIAFALQELPPDSMVIEFGGSMETEALASVFDVLTIEERIDWLGYAPNAEYLHAPLMNGWHAHDRLDHGFPSQWDCVIVNGPGRGYATRCGILKYRRVLSIPALWIVPECETPAIARLATQIGDALLAPVRTYEGNGGLEFAAIDARA